jgi:hypothetical protein
MTALTRQATFNFRIARIAGAITIVLLAMALAPAAEARIDSLPPAVASPPAGTYAGSTVIGPAGVVTPFTLVLDERGEATLDVGGSVWQGSYLPYERKFEWFTTESRYVRWQVDDTDNATRANGTVHDDCVWDAAYDLYDCAKTGTFSFTRVQ